MSKMPMSPERKNRAALLAAAISLALIFVLLCLPAARFTTTVFTKRSANTFVGDEKYVAARAEADEAAAQYAALGGSVEVKEEVTERVNSKGETTSLIVFNVQHTTEKSGLAFLGAGLAPSRVLMAALFFSVLAAAFALLGTRGSMSTLHRDLKGSEACLRAAGGFLAFFAALLVPVFSLTVTTTFSRMIQQISAGKAIANADLILERIDAFLYNGSAGEGIAQMLGGADVRVTAAVYAMLPALLVMTGAMIIVRKGALKETLARGALYLFVIVVSALILYPFYVMFITAFRSNAETTDMYFLNMLPTKWIWSNLRDILDRGVLRYLINSILLSTGATAVAMLCGIPAAYAMARMQFKGKNIFLGFVIMSQMFSPVVLLVGISQLMNTLHLNDTIIGLMLINAAFNQAFAIWLLRGTFLSISPEMEQAACIDGCNTVGALVNILLPMAAPGIVTTLIFVFINSWNEYTISTVLISTPANKPITVGITQFSSFNMIEWQYLFAAALLATVPVVILFMCIEKHLAAGLTSGGVKG